MKTANKLKDLVKEIQFRKDLTIEQIAESIGYSRVHLTKEIKKGGNKTLEDLLLKKYNEILQNVANETENQVSEPEAKYFTKTDLIEVIKAIKGTDDIHIIELIKKCIEDSSEKIAEKVKEKILDNNKGDPHHSSHSKAG